MSGVTWIEVDDDISECGVAEVASWASQAIEDKAVTDEFNPAWPGWEFIEGETPEERRKRFERERRERLDECSVASAWMQRFPAEDIELGEYPDLKMTHLVIDLATGERFYLSRTIEWSA